MDLVEDILEATDRRFGLDAKDVDAICSAIQRAVPKWKRPCRPLGISPKDWMPHLVSPDGGACHIHVVERLGDHWIERMRLAAENKRDVFVAAPLSSWHSDETLLAASELCIRPILVTKEKQLWRLDEYKSVAALIAGQKLLLKAETLALLGSRLLLHARTAKAPNIRGRLFEEFLAVLFSQVPDFEVFARNYRTETEEVDIVLKNRRTDGRAWPPTAPVVLVSGKNVTEPVGAPAVTSLESKMEKRRGMCRLGFLCSSGSFSKDAYTHELRYSAGQNIVVFIDGKTIDRLLGNTGNLSAELEKLVIEASLR